MKTDRKSIAFDIGNVLAYVKMEVFYRELATQLHVTEESAIKFCESVNSITDLGIMNMEQAIYNYLHLYAPMHLIKPYDVKMERLKEAWMAVVVPCKPTLEVVTELLVQNKNIALMSNIGIDHANYLSDICGEQFSLCTKHFSYLVGARKPQKLYYQSLLISNPEFTFVDSKFRKPLFFDDKLENIEAAKQYFDAKLFNINDYDSGEDAAKALVSMIEDIYIM